MSLQNTQVEFAEWVLGNEPMADSISPMLNMAIYRNQCMSRLVETLMAVYPLLMRLIGENAFKTAAHDYIAQYPSRSGHLQEYGAYFRDFLMHYAPAKHLPYLSELATFEWITHDLKTAADVIPFNPMTLKEIPVAQYAQLQFILNPACQIQLFHYPILDIIELCHGRIHELDTLNTQPFYLLITRQQDDMTLTPLTQAEYVFLEQCQLHVALKDALQAALQVHAEFDLNDKLTEWIKNHTIVDFIL